MPFCSLCGIYLFNFDVIFGLGCLWDTDTIWDQNGKPNNKKGFILSGFHSHVCCSFAKFVAYICSTLMFFSVWGCLGTRTRFGTEKGSQTTKKASSFWGIISQLFPFFEAKVNICIKDFVTTKSNMETTWCPVARFSPSADSDGLDPISP